MTLRPLLNPAAQCRWQSRAKLGLLIQICRNNFVFGMPHLGRGHFHLRTVGNRRHIKWSLSGFALKCLGILAEDVSFVSCSTCWKNLLSFGLWGQIMGRPSALEPVPEDGRDCRCCSMVLNSMGSLNCRSVI